MELYFNLKQKNVVAKINDDYYFLSKKPLKLKFENEEQKNGVLKHLKPLKPLVEEKSVIDETMTVDEWQNFPTWLENECNGAEGNLEVTKFKYNNITLYVNGGCLCGNVPEYALKGIIAIFKLNKDNANN